MKKSLVAIAIAASVGVSSVQAHTYTFSGDGFFTMITPTGGVLANPDSTTDFGLRTALTGLSMTFDTTTGAGTGSVDPFLFSGTLASARGINMQAIGDGLGGAGPMVMGSILFDYGPTLGIPVYLVADASGIFGAIGAAGAAGLAVNDTITGGVVTSTDAPIAASQLGSLGLVGPLGAVPFAMTTLDVQQDGDDGGGTSAGNTCGTTGGTGALIGFPTPNPAIPGGLFVCDDGVSGVRMATAPFPGHGANFDITSLTVTGVNTDDHAVVPVPAAVWLFGSGLLGLVGVARRKAS